MSERTIVERKVEDPTKVLAVITLSPAIGSSCVLSLFAEDDVEDMDENISGAPFPNANNVTPARDYDILNVLVSTSKEEDKYSSAVESSKYINMKTKKIPKGTNK